MRRAFPLTLLAVLVLAGCSTTPPAENPPANNPSTTAPPPTPTPQRAALTFVATEYNFTGPETATAGWTDITLRNDGQEPHQAGFMFIGDHSPEEFMAPMASEGPEGNDSMMGENESMMEGNESMGMPSWIVAVGGPNAVDPGSSSQATIRLQAGNYVILCFIPAPDGQPHVAHGMRKHLRVTAASGAAAPAPTPDVQLALSDFRFAQTPEAPAGGTHVWRVTAGSASGDHHEAVLLKLRGNATVMDFINATSGPVTPPLPADLIGGITGLGAGQEAYFTATLVAGQRYGYVCFEGTPPHFTKGMVLEFSVA
ncbi:MAG TPA: hypothetical protein VGR28_13345 [Candidatus Thermoplasmatota archaeon]|jgi:hypothetical protein|nr:hypothetical protein [Candidatus Thermoplasmatota archaeon]